MLSAPRPSVVKDTIFGAHVSGNIDVASALESEKLSGTTLDHSKPPVNEFASVEAVVDWIQQQLEQ